MIGVFQKLQLMVLNEVNTKIPSHEFQVEYPSEMAIINKVKRYFLPPTTPISLNDLMQSAPEFKPLLFLYNPQVFLSNPNFLEDLSQCN
jgi:hypothetical protein